MINTDPVWNEETAEWYAAEYGEHISNAMTISNAGLKKDDHLLDIGCGSGAACRAAAKIITNGTITGIDPTAAMVRIAKEKTFQENIKFLECSAENIPLENESITVCTAINSLHHWNDFKKGLEEVMRVLLPNGRLIISDEIVADKSCGHGDGPLADPDKVCSEILNAGFSKISLEKYKEKSDGIYLFSAMKLQK